MDLPARFARTSLVLIGSAAAPGGRRVGPLLFALVLALAAGAILVAPASAAGFTVNSTADAVDTNPGDGACATAAGECTLRAAIQETNALAGADTIALPAGIYTLAIPGMSEVASATGDLNITGDLALEGAGAATTIIQAGTSTTNGIDRVLTVGASTTVSITGVTIRYGHHPSIGGGIYVFGAGKLGMSDSILSSNRSDDNAAGLYNAGTVTISNSLLSANTGDWDGGAAFNAGTLSINDSTVSGNTAEHGGGVHNRGALTIRRSTFSGNTAGFLGGGIHNYQGTLLVINSTFSGNHAVDYGGAIDHNGIASADVINSTFSGNTAGSSGGTMSGFAFRIKSSVVADGSPNNCESGLQSLGYNISDDASCGFGAAGDQQNVDPLLEPLDNNGGPTQTYALLAGSPAIDAIPPAACTDAGGNPVLEDQRRAGRPYNANCDIGAFESGPTQLVVTKLVTNDNGGTQSPADFTITVDAAGSSDPAPFPGSDSGTTVSVNPGTYTVTEDAVPGYSASLSPECTGTIPEGEIRQCTITNDDQPGTLTVKKVVVNDNGGTLLAGDFSFAVNGGSAVPFEADGQNDVTVNAGSYTVTEPAVAGYTTTYDNCDQVAVPIGGSQTCTITNDDQPGTLIVIKHVVNDNGGTAVAADFTLDSGGINDSPDDFAGAEPPGTTVTLDAGAYNVSETGPSGYGQSFSADCTGSIANGQTKTCTVTNDDVQPRLVVIKHVVNDNGGTAVAGDFGIFVDGSAASPDGFAGEEAPGTLVGLNAGPYTVIEETQLAEYDVSYSADCAGEIKVGETKTCTITNDDAAPTLVVKKVVVNDNGGAAVAGDFTISVHNSADPASFPGDPNGTQVTLDAGNFNVSESGPSGYAASYSPDCKGAVALGQHLTCTVTNDDIQPRLTVTKVVVNDDGGTATVADFPLSVGGTPVVSGVGTGLDAGAYTVSETGLAGYAATVDGACNSDGTITLAPGDVKGCTVTNDDIPGSITVVKTVVNDNGGAARPDDFEMKVVGGNGFATSFPGNAAGTAVEIPAGTYDVTETGVAGYASSLAGDCTDVAVGLDQHLTCTVTNDDIQPRLTVTKVVVNNDGGTATVADFPLSVGGTPVVSGVETGLNAGVYTVSETGPSGYHTAITGDCKADGTVTLAVGDVKACTITNNDWGLVAFASETSANADDGSTHWIPVLLSEAAPVPVTVAYSLTPGTAEPDDYLDVTTTPGSLTFAPGQTFAFIRIRDVGDERDEDPDTLTLALTAATNAFPGTPAAHLHTITDDDGPPTVGFERTSSVVDEGASGAVAVNLSAASDKTVTVGYRVAGGTATDGVDFTLAAGTLAFAPGETSKTISLAAATDGVADDDETVELELVNQPGVSPVNANPGQLLHRVTINDTSAFTAPTVSLGRLPRYTRVRRIPIAVTGGLGVTHYLVAEDSDGTAPASPLAGDSRWVTTAPSSLRLSPNNGVKTIYAWTKNAAGEVSAPARRRILYDNVAPGARITFPAHLQELKDLEHVSISAPDPLPGSGTNRVLLALRRETAGGRCFFWNGTQWRQRGCREYLWLSRGPALRQSWAVRLPSGNPRFDVPGRYAAFARAGDRAGNITPPKALTLGVNWVRFRIVE